MTISIQHKLKPFSHKKGAQFLLPTSKVVFEVYPCRILAFDLETKKNLMTLDLEIKNFTHEFTAEADFEKRQLRIFGKADGGFLELNISKTDQGYEISLERFFDSTLNIVLNGKKQVLKLKSSLFVFAESSKDFSKEKLFLGVSKKQDLERIMKDRESKELLPYIFNLGLNLDLKKIKSTKAPLSYIEDLSVLDEKKKEKLLDLVLSSFIKEGFIPTLKDEYHQGLEIDDTDASPLYLLQNLALWLKASMGRFDKDKFHIFQDMPRHLIAGKALFLEFEFGLMHIEWTKGFIRQVVLDIKKETKMKLVFSKTVKSYRLKHMKKVIKDKDVWTPGIYHLDNFQA